MLAQGKPVSESSIDRVCDNAPDSCSSKEKGASSDTQQAARLAHQAGLGKLTRAQKHGL